jgi:membrane-bound ClpP family serine protease
MRSSRVFAYITGDRQGMETQIAQDCIDLFVDLLDGVGPTPKISLILHTNGGQTLAAWRLVNLIRTFCDELEVIVPAKALSAGTLIAIGANRIVMTKQAVLGPIDPSVNNPLNPSISVGNQQQRVPVSVESVRGYLDAAKRELGIKGSAALAEILKSLSSQVHPIVLGEVFRSRAQIRFLAAKLLRGQVKNQAKVKKIIDFLCADSGSHDYSINRREAHEL